MHEPECGPFCQMCKDEESERTEIRNLARHAVPWTEEDQARLDAEEVRQAEIEWGEKG